MKMPALQFYPGDWRKDLAVQSLGYFDRGVWFEMLCLMHESSERGVLLLNGAPMAEDVIARVLGLDNQTFNQTLDTLLEYGVAKRRESDGAIFNKRMVQDELLCEKRRMAGKMGGNPALVKQKPTIPVKQKPTIPVKQKPTPSSSSSSSDSEVDAVGILAYLNEKTGRNYKPLKASLSLISARLSEGATVDECKAVVDAKVIAWSEDPKMRQFLRPATLFNATKFANYVGEYSNDGSAGSTKRDWL